MRKVAGSSPPPATKMADSEKIRPIFFVRCSGVKAVRVSKVYFDLV